MHKITVAEIANRVDFSESHFMRYFKENMGTSFVDYLRDYRLTMAARLLLVSDETVLSISEEVGFDNLSYFSRTFKKFTGLTPTQYQHSILTRKLLNQKTQHLRNPKNRKHLKSRKIRTPTHRP